MAVRVGIEAAVAAQQARRSLEEVRNAIKDAAAEAREFARIDLAKPELKKLEEDLRRIEAALHRIRQASSGGIIGGGAPQISPAAPSMPGAGPVPLNLAPTYPGGAAVPPLAPSATPAPIVPPPAPPSPAASRRRRGGGGGNDDGSDFLGSIMGGFKFALGMAGLGSIASLASEGIKNAQSDAIGNDKLLRTLNDLGVGFDDLLRQVHGTADQLGVSYRQMQDAARSYAAIAGTMPSITAGGFSGVNSLLTRTGTAIGFARGYGLDIGRTVDTFARADRAGLDSTTLAGMTADIIREGHMDGKTEQVMNALLQWSETANRVMATQNTTQDFGAMYAALNNTGNAAFQGANASSLINTVNQSVLAGGRGGMAGHVELARAMIGEGVRDPYQQLALQQLGMFGRPSDLPGGRGDTTTFEAYRQQLQRDTRGLPALDRWVIEASQWGTNWQQARVLDGLTSAQMGGTFDAMRKLGLDPTKASGAAFAGIGQVVAAGANLTDIRNTLIGDQTYGFSDEEKKHLQGEDGETLRSDLIKTLYSHGLTGNLGTETSEAQAKQFNALTKAGEELLPVINKLQTGFADLGTEVTKGVDAFKAWLGDNGPNGAGAGIVNVPPGGMTMPISYETGGRAGAIAAQARAMAYGGGGSSSGLSGAERSARAARAMAFFEEHGYSKGAAAGIVANLIAESGLRFGASGDFGTARGLAQWHPDRLAAVTRGIGLDPTSSFGAGLAGVLWDLQHGDAGMQIANGIIVQNSDPGADAAAVSEYGIRPGDRYGQARARAGIARGLYGLDFDHKTPGSGHGGGDTTHRVTVSAEPIKVIHLTPGGQQLGVQYLPVTAASSPHPTNV